MARARGIKPGFFRNADLAELPVEARLLFIGLWTLADREGRLEDRPKQIKMEVFPADNFDVDKLLGMINDTGMLERYTFGGKKYLQIINFTKHQNPHRDERPSEIPDKFGRMTSEEPGAESPKVAVKPDKSVKPGASTMQAPCLHHASTMQNGLTPDSCILTPDSLTGGESPPPPFLPEYQAVIETERPDLDAPLVWRLFAEHYPERARTIAQWTKWVRSEFEPKPKANAPPATADPESRASIEALGLSLGIGKWDELAERFESYKAKVRGVKA